MTNFSSLITGSSSSSSSSNSSGITIQEINSLIGYKNSNAISGLVSGIDTDSIVAKLMASAAEPLIKMQQTQQQLEWQRDDYRSMNTLLQTLQTNVQTMGLQGTYLTKTVDSSNAAVATATAGTTAGNTTYTMDVSQLATSAHINGSTIVKTDATFDPTKSLWSQASNLNNVSWTSHQVSSEKTSVSTAGTVFQLKNGYIDSSPDLNTNISVDDGSGNPTTYSAANSNLSFGTSAPSSVDPGKAYINTTTGQITFGSQVAAGSTITSDYSYDTADLSIQTYDSSGNANTPQDFSFSPSTSLNDMLTQITQSNAGISAFYDSQTETVVMTRADTGNLVAKDGTGSEISAVDKGNSVNFFNQTLGLGTTDATTVHGQNASFTINGLSTTRASNTFTIGGTTFTLTGSGSATLNVTNDTSSVTTAINNFITLYNSTISQINSKIDETADPNYLPLSSIQQSQMSATDISNWNTKAQQGMISNDSVLSTALSQMRIDLYGRVSGTGDSTISQLAQIGITVSSDYTQHGQLTISDPTKLQNAISTNSQAVMALFTNSGTVTNADGTTSTDTSQQGLMQRLSATISDTMTQIEQKAGNTSMADQQYFLGQNIDNLTTQISAEKTKLVSVEDRYYTQFNAMEQAIQTANQQSTYLQNFISSNG
ncbi:flagellar filament capping protein FliD [Sporolactobacillus sp. CQH2019]|uniref:flagellar filament capping protein FliD n=1 Tax=Sporolactobacillus sp. CQH2019 TaxID=3023512 RepID=UPI0023675C63|nr:flagellar filament capping protein FliD [Sporolactobacillus sp. CQH2019]MDD9148072.1 flagellar filament capping protein FliD [Sporolactobacillus sp. CQH2019]